MTVYAKIENNKLITAYNGYNGITGLADNPQLCLTNGFTTYTEEEIAGYYAGYMELLSDGSLKDLRMDETYIAKQLASIKSNKLLEINSKAKEYETNGVISFDGVDLDGNSVTVQIEVSDINIGKINGLINLFNKNYINETVWSSSDDTKINLTENDAYLLSQKFAEFSQDIWIEKQPYFKNLVEKATTADELNAIVVDYSLDIPTASV